MVSFSAKPKPLQWFYRITGGLGLVYGAVELFRGTSLTEFAAAVARLFIGYFLIRLGRKKGIAEAHRVQTVPGLGTSPMEAARSFAPARAEILQEPEALAIKIPSTTPARILGWLLLVGLGWFLLSAVQWGLYNVDWQDKRSVVRFLVLLGTVTVSFIVVPWWHFLGGETYRFGRETLCHQAGVWPLRRRNCFHYRDISNVRIHTRPAGLLDHAIIFDNLGDFGNPDVFGRHLTGAEAPSMLALVEWYIANDNPE